MVLANASWQTVNPFQGGDNDVDRVEGAESSQKSTAARQKLYSRGERIPMDIGRLYKFYLPHACKQLLRNVVAVISRWLNGQRKKLFHNERGLPSDGYETCLLINENRKYKFSFKYPPNRRYYFSMA